MPSAVPLHAACLVLIVNYGVLLATNLFLFESNTQLNLHKFHGPLQDSLQDSSSTSTSTISLNTANFSIPSSSHVIRDDYFGLAFPHHWHVQRVVEECRWLPVSSDNWVYGRTWVKLTDQNPPSFPASASSASVSPPVSPLAQLKSHDFYAQLVQTRSYLVDKSVLQSINLDLEPIDPLTLDTSASSSSPLFSASSFSTSSILSSSLSLFSLSTSSLSSSLSPSSSSLKSSFARSPASTESFTPAGDGSFLLPRFKESPLASLSLFFSHFLDPRWVSSWFLPVPRCWEGDLRVRYFAPSVRNSVNVVVRTPSSFSSTPSSSSTSSSSASSSSNSTSAESEEPSSSIPSSSSSSTSSCDLGVATIQEDTLNSQPVTVLRLSPANCQDETDDLPVYVSRPYLAYLAQAVRYRGGFLLYLWFAVLFCRVFLTCPSFSSTSSALFRLVSWPLHPAAATPSTSPTPCAASVATTSQMLSDSACSPRTFFLPPFSAPSPAAYSTPTFGNGPVCFTIPTSSCPSTCPSSNVSPLEPGAALFSPGQSNLSRFSRHPSISELGSSTSLHSLRGFSRMKLASFLLESFWVSLCLLSIFLSVVWASSHGFSYCVYIVMLMGCVPALMALPSILTHASAHVTLHTSSHTSSAKSQSWHCQTNLS